MNEIWTGVPEWQKLDELVRLAAEGDVKAKSGLRGAIQVMRTNPKRERVVKFLIHVVKKC